MKTKRVAVYPGSFDPPTRGHIHVLEQAAALFDVVHVLVAMNADKAPLLTPDARLAILTTEAYLLRGRIEPERTIIPAAAHILMPDDLTVLAARRLGAQYVVRGVRDAMDWQYEQGLQHAYAELSRAHHVPELTFVYFGAPLTAELYTSSSLVRGLMLSRDWETSVSPFVRGVTLEALRRLHGDRT